MTYIIIFISLFIIEFAYFRIADKFNIIDHPNQRSSHTSVTIRGGGIVFYFGVLIYFIVSQFEYPWFFAGLTLISIISFSDDIKSQSPTLRFFIQLLSLSLIFFQWNLFDFPWYIIVMSLIVGVGIFNAFNFMDGINGMTGVYSMTVIGSFWYINANVVEFVDTPLIYIVLLSVLVFNVFNFRTRAKCFAGDIGAISMAFIVVFLLGMLIFKTRDFTYLALLVVYGVEVVLTIIHRLILKENIFEPHRKHLFQILANEVEVSQLVVSLSYALLQVVIFIGLIVFNQYNVLYFLVVSIVLTAVYILLKRKYFHLHQ